MKRVLGFIGWIWGIACAYALVWTFVSNGGVSAFSGDTGSTASVLIANVAENFVVLLAIGAVVWLLAAAARRFGLNLGEARFVGTSYASALLLYLYVLKQVNLALLPDARSATSIAGNVVLWTLTVPAAWVIYRVLSWLRKPLPRAARSRWLYGAGVAAASAVMAVWFIVHAGFSWAEAPAPKGKYNLLIITVDTLRRDYVSCYGERSGTTPNLDRFAEKAVVFEESFAAAPWTTPSMMAMHSGCYPSVHNTRSGVKLADTITVLAEVLRGNGYRTDAAVASVPAILGPELGFGRGFDSYTLYAGFPGSEALRGSWLVELIAHVRSQETAMELGDTTPWVTERALGLLDEAPRGRPFFAWVHYFDPHYPYTPPETYLTDEGPTAAAARSFLEDGVQDLDSYTEDRAEVLRYLYRKEVEYVDAQLGLVLRKLETDGFLENTVVIITADHGEEFFEHGKWGHGGNTATQGPSHHVEVVAVPLLIYVPDPAFEPGRVPGVNVSSVDLRPTILEILGLPPEPDATGTSLVRFMKGEVEPERAVFVDETCHDLTYKSVRRGSMVLIRHGDPPTYEMFDRCADPAETVDIRGTESARAESLEGVLNEWLAENEWNRSVLGPATAVEITDSERDTLRSLGYAN